MKECTCKIVRPDGSTFSAGTCMHCRIMHTKQQGLRCLYELDNWNGAMFVTLTYDEEHCPDNYNLKREDFSKFIKRVRRSMEYDGVQSEWIGPQQFTPKGKAYTPTIRYYACGEYGESRNNNPLSRHFGKVGRPHYHAIIYGLDYYNPKHWRYITDNWTLCEPWHFDKSRGQKCAIQPVTGESIEYVTGYVRKKLSHNRMLETYGEMRVRAFTACSHEIGLETAKRQKRLYTKGYTFGRNGVKISVPRYFRDKLDIEVKKDEKYAEDSVIDALMDDFCIKYSEEYGKVVDMKTVQEHFPLWERRLNAYVDDYYFKLANRIEADFHQREKLNHRSL